MLASSISPGNPHAFASARGEDGYHCNMGTYNETSARRFLAVRATITERGRRRSVGNPRRAALELARAWQAYARFDDVAYCLEAAAAQKEDYRTNVRLDKVWE